MPPTNDSDLLPDQGVFGDHSTPPSAFDESEPPRRSIWQYLGVAGFLLMALLWIWIFAIRGRGLPHPDELGVPAANAAAEDITRDERTALNFITEAEAVCATAQAEISQLPLAAGADDFNERAAILDQATERLDLMVNELGSLATPTEDGEAFIVGEWIKDYYQFLDDRRAYSDVLRTGDDPPFVISARDGRRVTNYIVTFAEVNNMFSCVPPGDV